VSTTTSHPSAAGNLAWADRLRNLATVLVIAIHVAGPIAHEQTQYDTWHWWSANLWDGIARVAVPLFVMLSGYLLLGKDYPLPDFLKRRFSRVAIPAIAWSAAYSLYGFIAHKKPATLQEAWNNLLENEVHYHLWFVYLILGLYLVYPILRPWVRQARDRDYLYFLIMWAIGAWGYKILDRFLDIQLGLYFELFTNHAGTFVMGYYLGSKPCLEDAQLPEYQKNTNIKPWNLHRRQLIWLSLVLMVLGSAATVLGTYWLSKAQNGVFNPYFYDYLTPNVGLATAGFFIFAQQVFRRPPLLEVERDFAAASFGIYFVHVFVLDWWSQCGYWAYKFHPAKCIPIIIGLCTIVSFLLILFVRVLPGGKKIT
jgi:surface polysaccharide O-acyltransferase-like enzyme